jgi:hypothetical protein
MKLRDRFWADTVKVGLPEFPNFKSNRERSATNLLEKNPSDLIGHYTLGDASDNFATPGSHRVA